MADAVITFTETRNSNGQKIDSAHIICDWLSATAGSGSATTTYSYTGQIKEVLFVPDTSGTAPSDLYDITITDGTNDLLFGQGANLSGTLSVVILYNLGCVDGCPLTITIANAGDANGGLIYIYIAS